MRLSAIFIPLSSLLTLGLLYLVTLSACNPSQTEPIRYGSIPWAGYETFFLARGLNLYPADTIQLKELSSNTETLRAFRQGQLEVAGLTLDETLRLAQSEPDIRILLVTNISNGADKIISRPEIQKIEDLKGKRIAVEESTVGAYFLFQTLHLVGLRLEDIQPVSSTINQHESMMHAGVVDAVVTFDPAATRLEHAGFHRLLDSSEIKDKIIDIIVTRKTFLETHSKSIEKLIDIYWQSQDFLFRHPQRAYEIIAPRLGVSPEDLPAIYNQLILPDKIYHQQLMQQDLQQMIEQQNIFMLDYGLIDNPVDAGLLLGKYD